MLNIRKIILSLILFISPVLCMAQESSLTLKATNKLPFGRMNQTIPLMANQLQSLGDVRLSRIHVQTAAGRELLVQAVDRDGDYQPDEVIFQADFGPHQTRRFQVYVGHRHIYKPEQYKAYGRFNRKRFGDFAWENDRIAHRVYGKALETWKWGALTSSAVDVWVKRTDELVINDWYMTGHYHTDTGEGGDIYRAGTSRGVGGDGIWADDRLWVSDNYRTSHVLTNGPIRVMFTLTYDMYNVAGGTVKEIKKISLDAGQNLSHYRVTYDSEGLDNLIAAIGIEKTDLTAEQVRKGIKPGSGPQISERSPGAFTHVDVNAKHGWITTRQPLSEGTLNCAIIVAPENFVGVTKNKQNKLVLVDVPANQSLSYWVGYWWSKSGQFEDYEDWKTYIDHFARGLRSPIQVTMVQ